ncbi:MAG: DUF4303 domain-containing protein [Bacillota bacterium]
MVIDRALTDGLKFACAQGWAVLRRENPSEFFYAFGIYTTPSAEYFIPFACGELGLASVAKRYLEKGSYRTLDGAKASLRWSICDSPYHERMSTWTGEAEAALAARPEPYDLTDAQAAREKRIRFNSAVVALRELDEQGLFNDDGRRRERVLLIEAGDRADDFVLRHAKKLNPADVFAAYRKQRELPAWGRYVEMGTKKVYDTKGLAFSGPEAPGGRHLYAVADTWVFAFDAVNRRQLWHTSVRHEREEHPPVAVATPANGSFVATVTRGNGAFLAIWSDPSDPKSFALHRLPCAPNAIAADSVGRFVAVAGNVPDVHLFSPDGCETGTLSFDANEAYGVDVSPDGGAIVAAVGTAGAWVWRLADGAWKRVLQADAFAQDVRFAPDGQTLISAVRHGPDSSFPPHCREALVLWDATTGRRVREYRVDGFHLYAPAFDATGQRIACCAKQPWNKTRPTDPVANECFILDTASGRLLDRLRLPVHVDCFNQIEFIDQTTLAIAAWGLTLRPVLIWETGASGRRNDTA